MSELRCAICHEPFDEEDATLTADGKICPTCTVSYYPEIADA